MRISAKERLLYLLVAVFCLWLWYNFEYPRFSYINLSVDRKEALAKAETYLSHLGVNTGVYSKAIVFNTDNWSDRYLQKTLGPRLQEDFLQRHDFELFSWQVRFFKQLEKEEYIISISPKTGNVLGFRHLIEDVEARRILEKEIAKEKAEEFLKSNYGLDFKEYEFHAEQVKRFEQRLDYSFSWEKKGVYIPWKAGQGQAKLLVGATVSGNEIREFYRNLLDIPEKFRRYIDNQLILGEYLYSLYFLIFIILISWSIFIVVKRKHTLVIRVCKKWYIYLAAFFLAINLIYVFNNLQVVLYSYSTSSRLISFIGIYLIKLFINIIFLTVVFIMPGLAGESLCSEVFPDNKYCSFFHYIKSTFYSRGVTSLVIFGYILFFMVLGLQATIFYFGQKYLGVWREWFRLTQFSSAYLPLLSAFIIGSSASLSEEIIFRLFGISLLKKYLKRTVFAVVLVSLLWGFGHSGYAIFPVWFRGIEVSIIGVLFGYVFIRFGLMPLIVAHYLLDVFLGVSANILGKSSVYLFVGSLLVLAIPLAYAAVVYVINKKEDESEIRTLLDPIQEYNLKILITFVASKKSQGLSANFVKEELIRHNWDMQLVDLAINEIFKPE